MNICIFGDSITWGACDYEKGGWAERLKMYYLENGDDVHVYNLGIAGETTLDLLKRVEIEARNYQPDMIVIAIGINDSKNLGIELEGFNKNITKLTEISKKIASKVIFVGLTRVDEAKQLEYKNENIEKYDLTIKTFCQKAGLDYIEINKVITKIDLDADGIHPNSSGHEKMFQLILHRLEEVY